MRLPGRHVLYALSAVTMLAACSSNGARGGIASTEHESDKPTRNCGDRYRLTDTGSAERANRDLD